MKPKLGRGIYYASVIVTIIALILVMVLFTSSNYTDEEISVIRYIAAYFSIKSFLTNLKAKAGSNVLPDLDITLTVKSTSFK